MAIGTIIHIFWACLVLRLFWEEVATTIKNLTSVNLQDNPAACLLHLSERPVRKYKKNSDNATPQCSKGMYSCTLEATPTAYQDPVVLQSQLYTPHGGTDCYPP